MTILYPFGLTIFTLMLSINWSVALDAKSLPLETKDLFQPPLQEIADVFAAGLKKNFAQVETNVIDCPDLTKDPFKFVSEGLNGNAKLIDLGGAPFLFPLVDRSKVYDLKDLAKIVDSDPAFIIGAAPGPHPYTGVNCEAFFDIKINKGDVVQQSKILKVGPKDETVLQALPKNETRVALWGNFLVSEGKPGKVIKVSAKKRTGPLNFIEALRQALSEKYKEKLVGIGGTFMSKAGKATFHLMRDFSKTPIKTDEEVRNWQKYFNMSAPFVGVGTFVSNDGGDLDLRVQHFHSFNHHSEGGHYHYDITPDIVEYLGYFNVGEKLYRIDKPSPSVTNRIGRE